MLKEMLFQNSNSGKVMFTEMKHLPDLDTDYRQTVLKEGTVCKEGAEPLPCDIIMEENVPVTLRDGVTIYTDVYRPVTDEKIPGIIAWSPYGKKFPGPPMPYAKLSGLQKFEGPDPAFWCANGYAVLNVDIRGINASEGDFCQWGRKQAEDGYDFVEWTAANDWCSGAVTFAGNSYLAISQWFIASMQPPHLACIAPWEGFSDVYEHSICAGGLPDYEFEKYGLRNMFHGPGIAEDMGGMAEVQPFWNDYWDDKRARVEEIRVPAYVVASYTNKVHTRGTLESYRQLGSKYKWLRIHNTHEWFDFYSHQEDLLKFFDFFTKGIKNGWEDTAPVRMAILNPGGEDITDLELAEYPFGMEFVQKFYLDASDGQIRTVCPANQAVATYTTDENDPGVSFTLTFPERVEIIGNICVQMRFTSETAKDADVFVMAQKLDADDKELPVLVSGAPWCPPGEKAPFEWGNGRQRASKRLGKSSPIYLDPGHTCEINVVLCPMGMVFEPGQKLRLTVLANNPAKPELPDIPPTKTANEGSYHIYTGKGQVSAVYIPMAEVE